MKRKVLVALALLALALPAAAGSVGHLERALGIPPSPDIPDCSGCCYEEFISYPCRITVPCPPDSLRLFCYENMWCERRECRCELCV